MSNPIDIKTGFEIPVISDVVDWASDRVEDAWDLVDEWPILEQLGDVTKAFFTGPLKDFAKTALGQTVLRAMTTLGMAASGGLAGPWAMMASASLPGVLSGQSFEEALITENLYRATEAVKILTANQVKVPGIEFPIPPEVENIATQAFQVLDEVKRRAEAMGVPIEEAVQQLAAQYGVPNDLQGLGLRLAREMGVREDFAVQAMEMASKQKLLSHELYDLGTGAYLRKPIATQVVQTRMSSATLQPRNAIAAYLAKTATAPIATVRPSVSIPSPLTKAIRPDVDIVSAFRSSSVQAAPPPPPPPPPAPPMMLDRMASNAPPAPEQGKGNTLLYIGAAGMLGLAVWYGMRHRR